jgi:site-specific recombinase XerD
METSMIADGLSVSVINRRLAALRSLIAFAHDHGLVDWTSKVGNQPITPTTPTAASGTSADDIEQIRAYLHRPTWNATDTQQNRWRRDGALFEVLASTGIRPEEVPRLSVSALVSGVASGHLFIPSHSNRGAEVRQVLLSKQAFRAINHWVELRWPITPTTQTDVNEPMFIAISRHGHFTTKALTSDGIRKILKRIAIKAHVDPRALRPHQLQRYALTQLANQEPTTITTTISGQKIEAPHDSTD